MTEVDGTALHEVNSSTNGCMLEASPCQVDSGAELTLKGKVVCPSVEDLRGQEIHQ